MGKVAWDAKGEVQAMIGKIEILDPRAGRARRRQREEKAAFGAMALSHHAHGVLAVFGPFNFPGHLPNGHIVPALLAGNCVLFKPSEITPGVGALMVEAWEEAGLPAGVLNLLQGARETGAALLDAPGLNGVLFTGSAQTGALIHRKFAGRPDVHAGARTRRQQSADRRGRRSTWRPPPISSRIPRSPPAASVARARAA